MKIIITEGQYKEILNAFSSLIKMKLNRYNIVVDDVDITPNFFPRGVNVVIRLNDMGDKGQAKEIVKSILDGLISFGKIEISFT